MEGLGILKANKINPKGIVWLMERLKAEEPIFGLPKFLSSHPLTQERINYLDEEASKVRYLPESDIQKSKREDLFKKLKAW